MLELTRGDLLEIHRGIEWAAGLFEGEGCIRVDWPMGKNQGRYIRMTASLTSTDHDVVESFYSIVRNGYVRGPIKNHTKKLKKPGKDYWTWCATSKAAYLVMSRLRPYLLSRRLAATIDAMQQQEVQWNVKA